jgi:ADP-heptose:LPS heptosyltransferase
VDVPGVIFYSLQTGAEASQAARAGIDIVDFSAELADFAESAALVQNLDLVVTIDTSVAHLAGALAKPVWVLIPVPADFRWLVDRTDTVWYPTMQLFRQKTSGDWATPVGEMAGALRKLAASCA